MIVALIFLPVLGGIFGKPPPRDEEHERAIEASETGDWRDIPGITGWYAQARRTTDALSRPRLCWVRSASSSP